MEVGIRELCFSKSNRKTKGGSGHSEVQLCAGVWHWFRKQMLFGWSMTTQTQCPAEMAVCSFSIQEEAVVWGGGGASSPSDSRAHRVSYQGSAAHSILSTLKWRQTAEGGPWPPREMWGVRILLGRENQKTMIEKMSGPELCPHLCHRNSLSLEILLLVGPRKRENCGDTLFAIY